MSYRMLMSWARSEGESDEYRGTVGRWLARHREGDPVRARAVEVAYHAGVEHVREREARFRAEGWPVWWRA